ncbi:MAG: ribonuclease Y [Bdellovibrionales bacterium]|nr:ribonuclease Y [Bdellovibrionales bacterium]
MDFSIVSLIVGLVLGFGIFFAIRAILDAKSKKTAQQEADRIINRAKSEANKIAKDSERKAKDFEVRARKNAENDIRSQKEQVSRQEGKLKEREKQLEKEYRKKADQLEQHKSDIKKREEVVKTHEARMNELEQEAHNKVIELQEKLKTVANINPDEAKEEIKKTLEEEAKTEVAQKILVIEEDAKTRAEQKAKRIIGMAISRYAGEFTTEKTVSVVPLPDEELKGKIIGREGRNIRAIESLCGVDLIIDETPEAVVISGFDPVRREVAKRSLEKLMEDGRIHPGRIEEVVDKTKKDLFKYIKSEGEKACLELGLQGVHGEIHKLLGSLKYRTSYAQNNYSHSLEVGMIAGLMAAEVGADVKAARRAGLFHDLGKAMDHSVEGSHAVIGADFAKRYGEAEAVCHAIRAHHEDEKPRTMLAYLVMAADAMSGARPGARKSIMENYVQRLEDLESVANSFDGVERTFAIQAGREIRVIVDSSRVTDEQSVMLSRDIARKIEKELKYPGQIKISVVRETRAVEHAR